MEIKDTFFIPKKGVAVVGDIDEMFKDEFAVSERVKIMRPDGTHIFSRIQGVEYVITVSGQRKIALLLDSAIVKDNVPRGSVMTTPDFQESLFGDVENSI